MTLYAVIPTQMTIMSINLGKFLSEMERRGTY